MRIRIALIVVALLALSLPASAHANLIEATPGANARLSAPPQAVRLTFTEPVEASFSRIRLLDLSGAEVLRGGAVDPADLFTMSVPIPADLALGVYTVSWRTISAADGHSTQGSYAFGIGMAAGSRSVMSIDEAFKLEAVAARWLDMLGTALTLGVVVFAAAIWRQGAAQGLPGRDERFLLLMRAGWVLAGVGLLVGLLAQTANVTGGSVMMAISDGSAARLLADSNYGPVWLGRAAVWVVLGGLLTEARSRPALWGALFGVSVGLAVLPSLVSHARADGSAAALINDMLHRTTAALWVGGLFAWVVALWPDLTLSVNSVHRAMSRFSNLARFYVLLLAVGGLLAATQRIPTVDALLDTGYGRALTVKSVLFGLMFALAAFNLLVVERRLKRGNESWIDTLRITVSAEMMLGAALMVMSSVMASSIPAKDVLILRAQAIEMAAAPVGEPFLGMQSQGNVMMHLEVFPGMAGENEFIVSPYLLPDTAPIEDATRVRLRFTNLEQNLGESTLDADYEGEGTYIAKGANLSIPGAWRVRVTLQRPGAYDSVLDFDLTIPLP